MSFDEKPPVEWKAPEPEYAWAKYASGGNPFFYDGDGVSKRIESMSKKVFALAEKMKVDFLDVVGNTLSEKSHIRSETVYNYVDLQNYLDLYEKPKTRIISICAPNSIKPLNITDKALHSLLSHHNVGTQFLDLFLSFAKRRNDSEAGPGSMTVKNSPDGSYEVQYLLSYVEEVADASSPWAIRQTGVYHRHVPKGPGSVWIFLHPRPNSTAQKRLEQCAVDWDRTDGLLEDWEYNHILVLSSYLADWRWYLSSLSAEIEGTASIALSLDFEQEGQYARGTDTLQQLHSLLNRVLPLIPRLKSTQATITSLKTLFETLRRKGLYREGHSIKILDELRGYEVRVEGYLASVGLLEKRIHEILRLLGVALNLKSQSTAVNINRNIWSLTKDTVDDSATVKLVTIVTLLYLPASFVASFLGMNLFSFQSPGGAGFTISKQFWIYFLITIPLTLLTVGSWMVIARKRKRQKAQEEARLLENGGKEEV